ncbi:hypothetical protein PTSG_13123 [Salpingoeca rosetta]|uniref:DNA polymerase kappa n=1 Tax=Salpingoeca rosetta (strain ATCC 50818 / BSB-021) TaxID=946362 RepID=F2URE9_SALR5|nr:uncharacterized protein PTSG_13123 [Salpingoeca rosetta]EGD80252.1 hypothetical protein PTSG_13123 [Salpingoeca rosetta]|eukprot:XP_004988314.1 hypothetical protein PTSG_13123 [Salpingoeca rosetta]
MEDDDSDGGDGAPVHGGDEDEEEEEVQHGCGGEEQKRGVCPGEDGEGGDTAVAKRAKVTTANHTTTTTLPSLSSASALGAPCAALERAGSSVTGRLAYGRNKTVKGVDHEKVMATILATSGSSAYMKRLQERSARTVRSIASKTQRWEAATPRERRRAAAVAEEAVREAQERLTFSRVYVHCDMDAFYASVEERDNPDLKGKPMAVGGMKMLTTANYEARKYGVRSAMPGYIGKALCPHLILIKPRFPVYKSVSAIFKSILRDYDPDFLSGGLDEASLDITDCVQRRMDRDLSLTREATACALVEEMRARILAATNLTASAGIACTRRLAKTCSDWKKPNGQYFLPFTLDSVTAFLRPLPIRKLSGIGNVTEELLRGLGVETVAGMLEQRAKLQLLFRPRTFQFFMHVAHGVSVPRTRTRERKSISTERTFDATSSRVQLLSILNRICSKLTAEMQEKQLAGRCLTLKVKLATFHVLQRSVTLPTPIADSSVLFAQMRAIMARELEAASPSPSRMPAVRLLGVRVSSLTFGRNRATVLDRFVTRRGNGGGDDDGSDGDCDKQGMDENEHSASRQDAVDTSSRGMTAVDEDDGDGDDGDDGDEDDMMPGLFNDEVTDMAMMGDDDGDVDGAMDDGDDGFAFSDVPPPARPLPAASHDEIGNGNSIRGHDSDNDDDDDDEVVVVEAQTPLRDASCHLAIAPTGAASTIPKSAGSPLCPVCGRHLPTENAALNTHVDECLNRHLLSSIATPDTHDMHNTAAAPTTTTTTTVSAATTTSVAARGTVEATAPTATGTPRPTSTPAPSSSFSSLQLFSSSNKKPPGQQRASSKKKKKRRKQTMQKQTATSAVDIRHALSRAAQRWS